MPYLGNELATQFQAFVTQTITGDGSTGYTLDRAVANGKELLVYINNVKQEEGSGKSYTASGTTITFSEAVASGDSCYLVYLGSAVQTVTPPDASVSSSKLVSGFPSASLDMNGTELILDADADTSITADTDDQIDVKVGGTDRAVFLANNLHLAGGTVARVQFSSSGVGSAAVNNNSCFVEGNDDTLVLNSAGNGNIIFQENGTERARITTDGHFYVGTTDTSIIGDDSSDDNSSGVHLQANGETTIAVNAGDVLRLNRMGNDGTVVAIRGQGTQEGGIEISGTTVTYAGFSGQHESSGIATNIPIGSVLSTIDELDVYPNLQDGKTHPKAGQPRADHAKVKVSDAVGDKRVYGVIDRYIAQDKVMVAAVGIASIRVTGACQGGDLLESNGDGTAKVQSDDVIKSKTIGKVTIGNSDTGVKLVSCVLYCG